MILRLLTLILLVASSPAAEAGARFALVVGNSAYEHAPPLANPMNDAALVRDTLADAGFQVELVIDSNYRDLKQAMVEFGRKLRGSNIEAGLFFYAGHGVQVKGENYLIPVDAIITSEDEIDLAAINVNDFLRIMNSSDADLNIVILDACRDNPFKAASRSLSRGLAPIDAPKGTFIAYATAPGDVALDGENGNSPYTSALVSAIRQPGLSIERVFKATRSTVLATTGERQVPWEVSSIVGEFYFRPAKPSAAISDSGVGEAFRLAEQLDSQPAWEAFLAEYGTTNDFYAGIAKQRLAALQPAPSVRLPRPSTPNERCAEAPGLGYEANLCVSSVLDPQFGNRYSGTNLVDGDPATAWVEGIAGQGKGENIVVEFAKPAKPTLLRIMNGYNKSRDIFSKNSRIRALTISTSKGSRFELRLTDSMGWQSHPLPLDSPVEWIALEIGSVFPGSKYADTAVSGLALE